MANNIFMGNGGIQPQITSIIDDLLRKKKDYITYEEILVTINPENERIKETYRTAIKKAISNINKELKKKGLTFDYKYNKNLRNNGRMRVKFDKWLVHIPFLCYLTILLISAEGVVYGGY